MTDQNVTFIFSSNLHIILDSESDSDRSEIDWVDML